MNVTHRLTITLELVARNDDDVSAVRNQIFEKIPVRKFPPGNLANMPSSSVHIYSCIGRIERQEWISVDP